MTRFLLAACTVLVLAAAWFAYQSDKAKRDNFILREDLAAHSDTIRALTVTARVIRARESTSAGLLVTLRATNEELADAVKKAGGTVRAVSAVTIQPQAASVSHTLRDTVLVDSSGVKFPIWTFDKLRTGRYSLSGYVNPAARIIHATVSQDTIQITSILTQRGSTWESIVASPDTTLHIVGIVSKINPFKASWLSRHRLVIGIITGAVVGLLVGK